MVTGVVPPPRYAPSFLSRIGFSIPTARRFSSKVANSLSRFLLINFYSRKSSYEHVHSVSGNWTQEIEHVLVYTCLLLCSVPLHCCCCSCCCSSSYAGWPNMLLWFTSSGSSVFSSFKHDAFSMYPLAVLLSRLQRRFLT